MKLYDNAPQTMTLTRPKNITFYDDDGEQIGCLSWDDGIFRFEGDTEESARVFFDWLEKLRAAND